MKNNGSLNRNFRHVWSDATQSWHVAPETARSAGKRSGSGHGACAIIGGVLTSVAMAAIATLSHAQQAPPITQLPTGGSVAQGLLAASFPTNVPTLAPFVGALLVSSLVCVGTAFFSQRPSAG